METIFDFNPTTEELRYLDIKMSKDEYIAFVEKWCKNNTRFADVHLAILFKYRNDTKQLEKYLSRFAPVGSMERSDFLGDNHSIADIPSK